MIIVRVTHDEHRPDIRIVTDKAGTFVQEGPAASGYFPQPVLDATSNPGDVAYFEATRDEIGDVIFGAPSTVEAFEAG